jgi:Uma2 family endonuclease
MMAGTSEPHVLIATNLIIAIGNALRGKPCRVYGSDLLVRIAHKSKYRFPDVSVVCGPTEFDTVDKGRRLAVSNPVILVEVLSETSEKDDRAQNFEEYRQIPSLREYVLVSQHKPLVEIFRRHTDGSWGILAIMQDPAAALDLQSINVQIPLTDLYAGVTFPPVPPEDAVL